MNIDILKPFDPKNDPMQPGVVTLNVERVYAMLKIDEDLTRGKKVEINAWYNHHLRKVVIDVLRFVLAENLQEIEFPADWWQAFKKRWAPRWFLRRWPVEYKRFTCKAYYPKLSLPDEEPVVRWEKR